VQHPRKTGKLAFFINSGASMRFVTCLLLSLTLLVSTGASGASSADRETWRKALSDLLAEQWEYTLRTSPLYASVLGDKRFNDQLDDFSQKAIDEDLVERKKFLDRFEAIDTAGFPEQEALNKTLIVRDLKNTLDGARFKDWEMPVTQFGGIHTQLPQLVSVLSFQSVKDYEDYISRLNQVPRAFDETVIQMRKGMAEKLMPARILLEQVVTQSDNLATQKPEDSPFAEPFAKFPKDISEADQKRIRDTGMTAIRDSVLPAYVKFTKFVKEEYAPKGRTEPGVWALSDGGERYAFLVKQNTTTNLTPEEIHQTGLTQVRESARLQRSQNLRRGNQKGSQAPFSFAPGNFGSLSNRHRPDVCKVAPTFRPASESQSGDHADRRISRKRISDPLHPASTRWISPGARDG
jgi:uncharacterized protein (DUF885 family)